MEYRHFSHNHMLSPLQLDEGQVLTCFGCERLISDQAEPFHGCLTCSFFLHRQCLLAPRFLHHPSHASHPLTLLPSPTYSESSFACSACRAAGSSFCLSCAECKFDLHIACANLPETVRLDMHPHNLKLVFQLPVYENASTVFMCDVCGGVVDCRCWAYHCADCDFGTHVGCVGGLQSARTVGKATQQPEAAEASQSASLWLIR